jgi:hypothetical protein
VRIDADTADDYLAALPDDRREALATVRRAIVENLPDGYVETARWGMISYEIPLERYPETYNGQPLSYAALASQKRHMSLYLMGVYCDQRTREWFEREVADREADLDIGKACVRFRKLDDLPLDLVAEAIAMVPVDEYIRIYRESRGGG